MTTVNYKNKQGGFIALMATVVLMAVLTITMFSGSISSFFSRYDALGNEFKRTSLSLSESCTNVALLRIAQNYDYDGNETVDVGTDVCKIDPIIEFDQIFDSSVPPKEISKKVTIITNAQYPINNGSWSRNKITALVKNPNYYIAPAPTCSFSNLPDIILGQEVTFGWDISGLADHFSIVRTIDENEDGDTTDPGEEVLIYESSAPEDSEDISPVTDAPPESATYTATVSGPGGSFQCLSPQSIEVQPSLACAETVMMLDRTGSMSGSDLDDEEAAANGLLDLYDNLSPLPKTSVGVFGALGASEPYNATILQSLTTIYSSLYNAVTTGLSSSGGYTNLYSAINKSQEEIDANASDDKEHVILLLSDGGANRPTTGVTKDTGLKNPSTATTPNEWLNPTNAFSSNNVYATASNDDDDQGYRSFNFGAIDAGAIILGIEVKAEAFSSVVSTPTTLISDSFGTGGDSNDIANWDEEGNDGDNTTLARQNQASGEDTASPDGGRFAKIANGEWICHSIDASGLTGVTLKYYWRGDADAEDNENAFVEYHSGGSCTSGSGWSTVATHELDNGNNNIAEAWSSLQSVSLPNNLNGYIRFRNNSSDSAESLRIDGVSATGVTTPLNTSCQLQARIGDQTNWSSYKTSVLSATENIYTLGSSSDDWDNVTWTNGDFTNANFRLETRFNDPDSNCDNNAIASLDNVQARVFYTVPADPYELALQAADMAKQAETKIFTIHFGDAGSDGPDANNTGDDQDFLARLASGDTPNSPHEDGSENDLGGVVSTDTGLLPPSTNPNPNAWTNPSNTFISDNVYSTDVVSGLNGHEQGFAKFNLNVPTTATIEGIALEVEAKSTDSNGCQVGAELSSNNGTNYTNTGNKITITSSSDKIYNLGDNTNLWGRTWIPADFIENSFIVKLKNIDPGNACTNGSTLSVDRIRARVYYSIVLENTDGDNFFIAPNSSDMPAIFETIGKLVCPALTPPPPPSSPPSPPPAPDPDPGISVNTWEEIINTSP